MKTKDRNASPMLKMMGIVIIAAAVIIGVLFPFLQIWLLPVQEDDIIHTSERKFDYYQWDAQGLRHDLVPIYSDYYYLERLEGIQDAEAWQSPATGTLRLGYRCMLSEPMEEPYLKIVSDAQIAYVIFINEQLLYSDFSGQHASIDKIPEDIGRNSKAYDEDASRTISISLPSEYLSSTLTVIEYVPIRQMMYWSPSVASIENEESQTAATLKILGADMIVTGILGAILILLTILIAIQIWNGEKPWMLLPICFLAGYMIHRSYLPFMNAAGIWADINVIASAMYIYCLEDLLFAFAAAKLKRKARCILAAAAGIHFFITVGIVFYQYQRDSFIFIDDIFLQLFTLALYVLAAILILNERKSNAYFKYTPICVSLICSGYAVLVLFHYITKNIAFHDLAAPISSALSFDFKGLTSLLSMAMLLLITALSTAETVTMQIGAKVRLRALEETNKFRMEFLGNVSHELKTPVTVLLNHAYNARAHLQHIPESDDANALGENIRYLEASANRLSVLTQQFLSVAAIDEGRLIPVKRACDIGKIIRTVARTHFSALNQGENELVIRVDPELPEICADAQMLEQVLVNLISNALRHTERGIITIAVDALPEAGIAVIVSDTGEGIAPENLSGLFERYNKPRENPASGNRTGLGLYICKEIVEMHGGKISIDSQLGKGTEVRFVLPKRQN